ncbi:hypothetical protein AB0D57_36790 [Streptomyces sp. NPDC048275]|uniref:hypothetical protein n=1 Tax=Streptomyces sp. NPDC048275 TaxID=3155629 RepID=UPI0033EEFEFF
MALTATPRTGLPAPPGPSGFPDWSHTAHQAAQAVPDQAVDACWRALNHLSAAQLYLTDNPRLARPLRPADVKETPRGHWGVCPPVNFLLAHLGPLTAWRPAGSELLVLHGAGHAGPSALAHAYLNGTLHLTGTGPGWSMPELRALITGFPQSGAVRRGDHSTRPRCPAHRRTARPRPCRRAGHGAGRPAPPGRPADRGR